MPVKYTRDLEVEVNKLTSSTYHSSALHSTSNAIELYGDLDALRLLDRDTLEREGLSAYTSSNVLTSNNINNASSFISSNIITSNSIVRPVETFRY